MKPPIYRLQSPGPRYLPNTETDGGRPHARGHTSWSKRGSHRWRGILENRTIPGFHAKVPWAAICNQSAALYGREGMRQRAADQQVLFAAIADYAPFAARKTHFGLNKQKRNRVMLESRSPWPQKWCCLEKAGKKGMELHNIAANCRTRILRNMRTCRSPRCESCFCEMTDSKKRFCPALRYRLVSTETQRRLAALCGSAASRRRC